MEILQEEEERMDLCGRCRHTARTQSQAQLQQSAARAGGSLEMEVRPITATHGDITRGRARREFGQEPWERAVTTSHQRTKWK